MLQHWLTFVLVKLLTFFLRVLQNFYEEEMKLEKQRQKNEEITNQLLKDQHEVR